MKLTGIKESDFLEIIPIDIEREAIDDPINAINCSISVITSGFSGKGEFWAGSNWHDFIQNLKNLDNTLTGNATLEWKVGSDQRMVLSVFNLDTKGHLFVRINIASDENYSDKNRTLNIVQTGFEIDPNALTSFIRDLGDIWAK
jgi:hypothetical protein